MDKSRVPNVHVDYAELAKKLPLMTKDHIRKEISSFGNSYPIYLYKYFRSDMDLKYWRCLLIDSDCW